LALNFQEIVLLKNKYDNEKKNLEFEKYRFDDSVTLANLDKRIKLNVEKAEKEIRIIFFRAIRDQ